MADELNARAAVSESELGERTIIEPPVAARAVATEFRSGIGWLMTMPAMSRCGSN